jgi:hypothetical protein
MSQQLTLEISDEVYLKLQDQASVASLSVPEWLITMLNKQYANSKVLSNEVEIEASQCLLNYAGAFSFGYATGADNESIDADLAKAYANKF